MKYVKLLHMIEHDGKDNDCAVYKSFVLHMFAYNSCCYQKLIHSFDTKKPGSTVKCMVQHKKARFDTKMPGSTQKCPPQHAPVDIAIIKHPPAPSVRIFFSNFIPIFCFYRKWNYIDINSKLVYSISLWKLKCNHSFLFVVAIMSAAIDECYRYGRILCQFLHFLLIAPLKSDTHVRRTLGPSSLLA